MLFLQGQRMSSHIYTYLYTHVLNDWPWTQGINELILLRVIYYFSIRTEVLGIWRYMGCMSLKSLCFCCVCFWVTSIIEMTVLIQCFVLRFSLTWSTLTLPMKYPRILQQTAQFSVLLLLSPRGLSLELLCDALTTPYLPFCPRAPHVRNTRTAQAIIPHSPSNHHGLSWSSEGKREYSWRNHLSGHIGWHVQRWQPVSTHVYPTYTGPEHAIC